MGKLVVTPGVEKTLTDALGDEAEYRFKTANCLARHFRGDWGDVSESDKAINDAAIVNEGDPAKRRMVMSKYRLGGIDLIIVTEADRSATTLTTSGEL